MDEILKNLAEHSGIDLETARNGLGALFAFLKQHLPAGVFGQVEGAIPEANPLASSFEAEKGDSGGGLMGAVAGLAGKLLGGGAGEASKLVAMLGAAGLDLSQIRSFLPKALELLQSHLPADLVEKIRGLIAGAAEAPEQA